MPFEQRKSGSFVGEKTTETASNATNYGFSGMKSNTSVLDSKHSVFDMNVSNVTVSTIVNNNVHQKSRANRTAAGGQSTVRVAYPLWCKLDSPDIPDLYLRVWHFVKVDSQTPLCDTNKLYPILLSSHLNRDILASIWAQVNKLSPGQLTTQELFLALAMVAIVQQNSMQYLNVKQLYYINTPPVPKLSFPGFAVNESKQEHHIKPHVFQETATISAPLNNLEEEFTDFQCVSLPQSQLTTGTDMFDTCKKEIENSKTSVVGESDFCDFQMAAFINKEPSNSSQTSRTLLPPIKKPFTTTHNNVHSKADAKKDDRSENLLLEMNGENNDTKDRYSALKELHSEIDTVDDDFGDFKSYSVNCDQYNVNNEVVSVTINEKEIFPIWLQMLQCCRQLLHKSFNVLIVNHGEESSIEALNTEEGKVFCADLSCVFTIAKRIQKRYEECGSHDENIQQLFDDIEVTFRSLNKLFVHALITLESDEIVELHPNAPQKICAICGSNYVGKRSAFLYFTGRNYHSSCANLWLNCINSSLPTVDCSNRNIL